MSEVKIPTNEEINSFLETYPSFRDFFEDCDWSKYSRKEDKPFPFNPFKAKENMEPNMKQVVKKIMSDALCGNQESKKLCVDMLLADNLGFKTQDETSPIGSFTPINFPNIPKLGDTVGNTIPTTCIKLKELVLSVLRHQGWTINDIKFSDNGNVESINIKFANKFTLGNSPWDPR